MKRKTRKMPLPSTPIESLGLDKFKWERAIMGENDLSATTRHVLLTLAVFMNNTQYDGESWRCFPAEKTLAESTALSEHTVCKHIGIAEQAGWIRIVKKGTGKGWRRHEYFPCLPDGTEPPSTPKKDGTELRSARCAQPDHGAELRKHGTEPSAHGTEPDAVMVLNQVQSTNHIPISYTNQLPTGAAAPEPVDKNGRKKKKQKLRAISDVLPNVGEKPVRKEQSAPLETECQYFEAESVLGITARRISYVPSLDLRKATILLRRQIEQRGQEAVEARCRQAPTDPIKCLVHVQQRDS